MSTRSTIKHQHDPETGAGFRLYTDSMDRRLDLDVVNLSLRGVTFTAVAGWLAEVDVAIPREWAEALGLVPARAPASDLSNQPPEAPMAYRMTVITPQVRIGINGQGEANMEVWTPSFDAPDAEMIQVFIPADALADVAAYLLKIHLNTNPGGRNT